MMSVSAQRRPPTIPSASSGTQTWMHSHGQQQTVHYAHSSRKASRYGWATTKTRCATIGSGTSKQLSVLYIPLSGFSEGFQVSIWDNKEQPSDIVVLDCYSLRKNYPRELQVARGP